MKNKHKKIGFFTLIELMVAMGIFALLMMLMFDIMVQVQDAWKNSSQRTAMFENARFALDLIQKDLEGSLLIPTANQCFMVDNLNNTNGSEAIGFVASTTFRPSLDARSRMAETYYMFDKDKGRLLYRLIGDDDKQRFDFFSRINIQNEAVSNVLDPKDNTTVAGLGQDPTGMYVELIPNVVDCKFFCAKRRYIGSDKTRYELVYNNFEVGEMPAQVRIELTLMDKENFLILKDPRSSLNAKKRAANNARTFTRLVNLQIPDPKEEEET